MNDFHITALSPIDGRYSTKTQTLIPYFSEFALIKQRVFVEIKWFQFLASCNAIKELPALDLKTQKFLEKIIAGFDFADAKKIKRLEATTNHDVKAVEYFLKQKFATNKNLKPLREFIHFALTSEDVNNIAYALSIKSSLNEIIFPEIGKLILSLKNKAKRYANIPMLARTHGQPASPTTLGKEILNFVFRLERQFAQLKNCEILAKLNGATGNFTAHIAAYSEIDWPTMSQKFIEQLGLIYNPFTTQIEPHDWLAELSHVFVRGNNVLLDCCQDFWSYISFDYFYLKSSNNEIGSSVMPHKINPIDFENAEGNLGVANSLLNHFANKLPISRLQRDLSDSTVLRNVGVAFAHTLIAYQALQKGLSKLDVNKNAINKDLNTHWEILAEAIQTVMRKYSIENPYEQLKALTRGKKVTKTILHRFIDSLKIPKTEKIKLRKLTPKNFLSLGDWL